MVGDLMRLLDKDGGMIAAPVGYHDTLKSIKRMVDGMEELKVDRSDMLAVLSNLLGEGQFYLRFLEDRE